MEKFTLEVNKESKEVVVTNSVGESVSFNTELGVFTKTTSACGWVLDVVKTLKGLLGNMEGCIDSGTCYTDAYDFGNRVLFGDLHNTNTLRVICKMGNNIRGYVHNSCGDLEYMYNKVLVGTESINCLDDSITIGFWEAISRSIDYSMKKYYGVGWEDVPLAEWSNLVVRGKADVYLFDTENGYIGKLDEPFKDCNYTSHTDVSGKNIETFTYSNENGYCLKGLLNYFKDWGNISCFEIYVKSEDTLVSISSDSGWLCNKSKGCFLDLVEKYGSCVVKEFSITGCNFQVVID